jgi:hypothetical protein
MSMSMQSRSHNPILPERRILRENRPVRIGLSDSSSCDEHPGATPSVRLIPDSTNPQAIEVICLCGLRLEIELVFPLHD